MPHEQVSEMAKRLTRPIIGIENRTAQEAFDIMCDRISRALPSEQPQPTHDADLREQIARLRELAEGERAECRHGPFGVGGLVEQTADTIEAQAREIAQTAERERVLVEALTASLDYYERQICHHDDTHRGGFLWTICDQCGAKWADDEGGFKAFEYPPEIAKAYELLATLKGTHHDG